MSIQHLTRAGKTYYPHILAGKTGKPKYHFSLSPEGTLSGAVPEGFEIYENVHAQVFLRRKTPHIITDEEMGLVKDALKGQGKEWHFKADVKKNVITIYEGSDNSLGLEAIAAPWITKSALQDIARSSSSYMAVLRFVLVEPKKRLFMTERFCFRGSVDDWIDVGGLPEKLSVALKKYVKHLGQDSMFELY